MGKKQCEKPKSASKAAASNTTPTTTKSQPAKSESIAAATTSSKAAATTSASAASTVINQKNLSEMGTILMSEIQNSVDTTTSYLVMDEKERIQAFLRNRDTNYVNLMDVAALKAEKIRLAVLSALRFDKQLVFDLMDNEQLIDSLRQVCAEVEPKLFDDLFSGRIKQEDKYTKLIKESDGELYKAHNFVHENMKHFKVILLISKSTHNETLLNLASPYKVV